MLLLYSVRMVRTGVERASGPVLRRIIADPKRGRITSAGAGLVVAVVLQSSTAAAVLASGFAVSGLITLTGGISLLLGADVGTALVVQFLSIDLQWLIPTLLAIGGWVFLKSTSRIAKQCGRIALGISFILISLQMISAATAPLKESSFMPYVAGYLADDIVAAFIGGAIVTFAVHSSVAAILMIAAFTAEGILTVDAALPILLGANVGGAMIAVWLTKSLPRKARLIPLGSFLFRAFGAFIALCVLWLAEFPVERIGATPEAQLINAHLLFNLILLLCCLPLTGIMAKLVELLISEPPSGTDDTRLRPASALDRALIKKPDLALVSTTRELLRMGELVEVMLRPMMDFFQTGNREAIHQIHNLDKEVIQTYTDIKLYIAEVNRGELGAKVAEHGMELTRLAINLERAGNLVANNLLKLAIEKDKKKIRFSADGWKELTELHANVMANIQLAMNVLISEDIESARQLIAEKDLMRKLEQESHNKHLERLRAGAETSIESSDIHLQTLRAFKEVNSLFASVAIPILSKNGQLLDSRLALQDYEYGT